MNEVLKTVPEVNNALGGLSAVAKLTGRTYSAAAQWPYLGTFPSNTYLIITDALAVLGKSAPASLWGMTATQGRETPKQAAAES